MIDFQHNRFLWGLVVCAGLGGTGSLCAEEYVYDDLGRLVSVTLDDGTDITYQYDPAGNRTLVETNGIPTAVDDTGIQVDQDTPKSIDVLNNDSDPNGDDLLIAGATQPANGAVAIIDVGGDDWVRYTPNSGYLGSDNFTYTITDGQASATANVSVAVVSTNDPPVAVNDTASTNEDQAKTINPLSNDSDPENEPLSLGSVSAPSHGSAVKSGNSVIYTPDSNYSGSDGFSYEVSDGELTSSATVSVTVNAVNDPPVASNDSVSTNEDTQTTFNPRINDTDVETPSSSLIITAKTNGSKGTVAIVNSGTQLRYTPNANVNGSDSFTYTIKDGANATDSATVSVTINPVNDPINAINDNRSTNEDTVTTFDPRTNDIEPDGQAVTITGKTNGSKGSVAIVNSGTRLRYTPQSNVSGSDSFTYTVSDGHSSDTATVSMTINAVNDPPVAVNDSYSNVDGTNWTVLSVLTNDSDPEGNTIKVTSVGSTLGGEVEIIYNGDAVRYRCGSCGLSDDGFSYTITDSGGATDTAGVSIYMQTGGGGGGWPPN